MLSAVSLISPVIIITLIPALWQVLIDDLTYGLGGSYIATIPTKTESFSSEA
jgi:hypothetical protein